MKKNWAVEFLHYHVLNPNVFRLYVLYADQALQSNTKFSTKLINERIRWDSMVSVWDYKTTNSLTAYYARLLMWKHPRFRNAMRLKRIPIDGDTKDIYDTSTWNSAYWGHF